jgi:hypothetical protein
MMLKLGSFALLIRNTWEVPRRMEKISWTDGVRNEVVHRVEDRYILHKIKRRKDNWTGHILPRN